jgi:hypothetical protein
MQPARMSRFAHTSAATALLVVCALPFAGARAQQAPSAAAPGQATPPTRQIPRPDELEPGVNTSTPAAPAAPGAVAPAAAPVTAPAAVSGQASASDAAADPAPGKAAAATGAKSKAPAGADTAGAKDGTHKGADRLQLDATEITGNRELPKVLYIVPWKRSDLGDVVGKPVNSLVDEVLQPLDRDVFQRENRYYDALSPAANAPKPGAVPGSGNKP